MPPGEKCLLLSGESTSTSMASHSQSEQTTVNSDGHRIFKSRKVKWLEVLSEYNHPGPRHGNADSLSRLPYKQCGKHTTEEEKTVNHEQGVATVSEGDSTWCPRWSKEEICTLHGADPDIKAAVIWQGGPLPESLPKGVNVTVQTLWHQCQQLSLKHGILF